MAKASELRELDDSELENKLAETKQELFNFRFQLVTGQLDNPSRSPSPQGDRPHPHAAGARHRATERYEEA